MLQFFAYVLLRILCVLRYRTRTLYKMASLIMYHNLRELNHILWNTQENIVQTQRPYHSNCINLITVLYTCMLLRWIKGV
jgi:hypothetical protein